MLKRSCLLMLSLWLLCGCSGTEVEAEDISEYYGGLSVVTLEADITVNSGVLAEYGILFTRTEEGDCVEITSPESLVGVRANILPDKAEIEYEGMAMETLLPGISGFVPADAVSGLLNDLEEGIPEACGIAELEGRKTVALTYVQELEGMTARKLVWLDGASYTPMRAEFYLDELMVMEVCIENFVT